MPYNYESIKKWRRNNRIAYLEYERNRERRNQRALVILLGGRCVLCNREQEQTPLIVHEIHGKSHSKNVQYIMVHKEDFTILCRPHHAMLHRLKNEGKLEIMAELCSKMAKGL